MPRTLQKRVRGIFFVTGYPSVNSNTIMQVEIENNVLVIRMPMNEPRPSASGKTLVVASSGGNQTTTAVVNGKKVIIGLNAYIPR
jgi:hypothetical protein